MRNETIDKIVDEKKTNFRNRLLGDEIVREQMPNPGLPVDEVKKSEAYTKYVNSDIFDELN